MGMEIIRKKDAKLLKLKFYYTGVPCNKGHIEQRYVSSGKCIRCEKDKARAVREANPEKIAKQQKSYREKNNDKIRERKRRYREENIDAIKERNKRYYEENKEIIHEKQKIYAENNKERIAEYQKKWKHDNYEYKKEMDMRYKEANREKLNQQEKERYHNNKEKFSKYGKKRYRDNREEKLAYANDYRAKNKEKVNERNREYRKRPEVLKRRREREGWLRKNCGKTKCMHKCRELFSRVLSVLNEDKVVSTYEGLGYNNIELKAHLEKYMIDGMTWNNHGTLWCIDHRWSVSYLVNYGITDPAIINSLDNLRPLLVGHNLSKHNKNEDEYFELYPEIAKQYPMMPEFKYD